MLRHTKKRMPVNTLLNDFFLELQYIKDYKLQIIKFDLYKKYFTQLPVFIIGFFEKI